MTITEQYNQLETFIPQKMADNAYTFVLKVSTCYNCKRPMMPIDDKRLFHTYRGCRQDDQMKHANIAIESNYDIDNIHLCTECVQLDVATFTCCHCNESKVASKLHETVGSFDPDYICTDCYATVPAKEFDELIETLQREHRYDNE
jgi:hypothetical protein